MFHGEVWNVPYLAVGRFVSETSSAWFSLIISWMMWQYCCLNRVSLSNFLWRISDLFACLMLLGSRGLFLKGKGIDKRPSGSVMVFLSRMFRNCVSWDNFPILSSSVISGRCSGSSVQILFMVLCMPFCYDVPPQISQSKSVWRMPDLLARVSNHMV